jgi:DNA polymerase-3 subunit epsilon
MRAAHDGCGCFPTGRYYPGIAHLLSRGVTAKGLAEEFAPDLPWQELAIAMIDTETTGRDSSTDRVIELGVVVGQAGEIRSRRSWLIDPGCAIPADATAVHGIRDEDVRGAPRFEGVATEVIEALRGVVPAAYHAAFDRAFLLSEFGRAGKGAEPLPPFLRREVDWVDPLVWARELHRGEEQKFSLGEVSTRLGVALDRAHRATDDAEAALRVLYALGRDTRMPKTYAKLMEDQRRFGLLQAADRRRWTRS